LAITLEVRGQGQLQPIRALCKRRQKSHSNPE
jgi:hypothetical protein